MKKVRDYIDTLCKSVKAWEYWINNGNTIMADVGADNYLYVIKSDTDKICDLDANEVKDVILEREDDISLRLRRINEYGLLSLLQKLENSKDIKASLINDAVNEAINTYFLRIYEKANDFCKIVSECEKYLPRKDSHKVEHKNPQMAIPNEILLVFRDKESAEEYLNWKEHTNNPRDWGRRYKDYGKPKNRLSRGDLKLLFEYLRKLYPGIDDNIEKFRRYA